MSTYSKVKKLNVEIKTTLQSVVQFTKYNIDSGTDSPPGLLPSNLSLFYKEIAYYNLQWETKELTNEDGIKLKGSINILTAEEVLHDWKGIVYFDFQKEEDLEVLKNFKIVDFFVDEACAGYLQNEAKSDEMYYLYLGEGLPEPMGVGFDGYLELMFMARGFWYWQQAVLYIKNGYTGTTAAGDFKIYVREIFPDFKWEEFVALYERVRIK